MKASKIIEALKNNQIVAIPTDTVYGLFALPTIENAHKINTIKKSPKDKKLSIMASEFSKYENILEIGEFEKNIISENLPGAKTFIVPLKDNLSTSKKFFWSDSIGIRVPDFFNKNTFFLKEVLDAFEFLFATSVNISGEKSLTNAKEIKEVFGNSILIVKEKETLPGKASTIISLLNDEIKVIRK